MVLAKFLFRLLCHQSPLRSPELGGVAFPLCWRCVGMHLGLVSAYFYLWVSGGFRRRLPEIRYVAAAILALLPFGLDGFGNAFRFWSSPPGVRAATGLLVGVVLPLVLVPLRRPLEPPCVDPPTISRVSSLLWPIALGSGGLVLLASPASLLTFRVLALSVALGDLLFLIHVCQALFSVAVDEERVGICKAPEILAKDCNYIVYEPFLPESRDPLTPTSRDPEKLMTRPLCVEADVPQLLSEVRAAAGWPPGLNQGQ